MVESGEEPLCTRLVAGYTRCWLLYRDQVFRAGQDEDILDLVGVINEIAGYSLGCIAAHARDAQGPTKPKRPVAIAGAVNQLELRLETVSTRGQSDRHGEISSASVQIRGEGFTDA